jgi:molybdenum cofactor biosynthesis enzyme MoaA
LVEYLSAQAIRTHQPYPWAGSAETPLALARARMQATGQWRPGQAMGRRWPIGCVALEVTQRCNLDCSLCYLSEHSEAVRDIPLPELFRRIDAIARLYGPDTDVQVTGGDPTLRKRSELVDIVARIRARGMRASLFTNGIRLKRGLLEDLVDAGLVDVAFHVDMTQGRRGYDSEADLNAVRLDYINRARGLPVSVFFNTTVFNGNLAEIADVAAFFVRHSDVVRLASFQLQADTGRGTEGARDARITMDAVGRRIEAGAGARVTFDAVNAGHAGCNRYAMALVVNGAVHDLFDDRRFIANVLAQSAGLQFDRTRPLRAFGALAGWFLRNPRVWAAGARWTLGKARAMSRDLVAARGRAHKLSFFIHDFMDACRLEKDRVEACAFMAATADGPISMCLHNAKRDAFILDPVRLQNGNGTRFWHPLTGGLHEDVPQVAPITLPPKARKGRAKPGLERVGGASTVAPTGKRPDRTAP